MTGAVDVVIIGAGPYGLSLAAHLSARGVGFRIFGEAMRFWRDMPIGINLKSLAFATNIAVPDKGYAYSSWCRKHGLEDFEPCTMQSFATYGLEMQKRFVPDLEEVLVTNVQAGPRGFDVTIASGETLRTRKVVVCTGLSYLAHTPEELRGLTREHMRHTFDISDYSDFRRKTVAVIGGGSSAIEAGVLVREAGGSAEIYLRGREAIFHGRTPRVRPLWQRIKDPISVLGASRKGWVLQQLPLLVHFMPTEWRLRFVKSYLGPASPWWIMDRVLGKVPIHVEQKIVKADAVGKCVRLHMRDATNNIREVEVEYIIAGTGYSLDVSRLAFLDDGLKRRIRCVEQAPTLSMNFESSVQGLYFTGPLSFMSFGPLFRFVTGADFAAQMVTRHLARASRSSSFSEGPVRILADHPRSRVGTR